jgi:hypothetical protein
MSVTKFKVTVAKMLNNLSLLSPTDTKLCARVPYIKTKLRIATLVLMILVKVIVAKTRISVSAQ